MHPSRNGFADAGDRRIPKYKDVMATPVYNNRRVIAASNFRLRLTVTGTLIRTKELTVPQTYADQDGRADSVEQEEPKSRSRKFNLP